MGGPAAEAAPHFIMEIVAMVRAGRAGSGVPGCYTWSMKFGEAADTEAELRAGRMFAKLVKDLVNQGFQPPLHLVTLTATGAMTLGRWVQDGEVMTFTPITHHFPPEGVGVTSDMYIVVVDAKGEATMVSVVEAEKGQEVQA